MTITLGSGSDQLTLYQAQETNRSIQGNVTVKSPFNTSAENTLLTGLEGQERVNYDGLVTGNRLSELAAWPDDRVQAIAEWTANFEAFVNGKQGTGWSFEDTDRDRDINIVIEAAGWQRSRAAKYEVEWNLSAIRGNGQMEQATPAPALSTRHREPRWMATTSVMSNRHSYGRNSRSPSSRKRLPTPAAMA